MVPEPQKNLPQLSNGKKKINTPASRGGISSLYIKSLIAFFSIGIVPLAILSFFLESAYKSLLSQFLGGTAGPNDIVNQLYAFRWQMWLLTAVILILIMISSLIISRRVSQRLHVLLKAVQAVRGGKKTVVAVDSNDEIGELADAFNETISILETLGERDLEISKAKSEFVSITAHQLRTPLTGIKWALDEIVNGRIIASEQKETLTRALGNTNQLIRIVGSLLDVVQIEEERFGYSFEKQDITAFIEKSIVDFSSVAKSHGIELTFDRPASPLPPVFMDPRGIDIVLENLISNAINYTPTKGTATISTAVDTQNRSIKISVTDNGIGIPPEEQQHIFEKFYRASNAKRTRPNGSGIGLFISKSIIERHKGTIFLESQHGIGSTFSFTLPLSDTAPEEKLISIEEFPDTFRPSAPSPI